MAYTNKMNIEISNIPKEKFDKLRDDVIRLVFSNGLIVDDSETGYIAYGFGDDTCGIDIAIKDKQ